MGNNEYPHINQIYTYRAFIDSMIQPTEKPFTVSESWFIEANIIKRSAKNIQWFGREKTAKSVKSFGGHLI